MIINLIRVFECLVYLVDYNCNSKCQICLEKKRSKDRGDDLHISIFSFTDNKLYVIFNVHNIKIKKDPSFVDTSQMKKTLQLLQFLKGIVIAMHIYQIEKLMFVFVFLCPIVI